MIEAERVLQPLRERDAAIEALDTYASAGELAGALASVREGLERSLRMLLRADTGASESARMGALAPETPLDEVLNALRRSDRISMELAGRLHEVEQAARRIEAGGEARASDADAAREAVRLLRAEVMTDDATPHVPEFAPTLEDVAIEAEPAKGGIGGRLAVAAAVFIVIVSALVMRMRASPSHDDAIAAFQAGDYSAATQAFETALANDSADVTALLYLARIHRREERPEDAAGLLLTAADRAPDDPDVRRELGWLFLDLERAPAAVEQFEMARAREPEDARNWIGLIRALRAANDPRADEVLREAPAEARAAFGSTGARDRAHMQDLEEAG